MAFAHRPPYRGRMEKLGDEALHFARWFRKSKFALMQDFLGEIDCPPADRDAAVIRRRFLAATRHAKRVLVARLVVTVLLAAGVVAAAAASLARVLVVPSVDVDLWVATLDRAAAVSASASVLLVALRLGFDRYLDLVQTTATFLAIELAATRCRA